MIHGVELVQVPIPHRHEQQARDFYGAILGLRELARSTDLADGQGVRYALPDGRELFCSAVDDFRPNRRSIPTVAVPDLEALADALGRVGHRAEWDFATARPRFYCADPFGNRWGFIARET
jgi:catechol 2,3-dioxygenase-like lactoylglutathione lyase family enzyme